MATPEMFSTIKSKPFYKAILGLNEPDKKTYQSPEEAACLYAQIVETGLRVGSPAPANTTLKPSDWFVEFISNIRF